MATILTRPTMASLSDLVADEYVPSDGYTREVVTVNVASAGTLALGTVLAKVTATGKYVVQDASLATGAGLEADCILIGANIKSLGLTVAAGTDTKALVFRRGPLTVFQSALTMGAGTSTAAQKQAVYDALNAKGIVFAAQL